MLVCVREGGKKCVLSDGLLRDFVNKDIVFYFDV